MTGYTSGATYVPGDNISHTYVIRCCNGTCCTDSPGVSGTDANGTPGTPVITSITDNNPSVQDGIHVYYTAGSGATSHDLYKDGISVVAGYFSGDLYNPGDTSTHTYVVRAKNGSCYTNSTGSAFADAAGGNRPGEAATGTSTYTAQTWSSKTSTSWPPVSGATSYTLYRGVLSALPNLLTSATDSCTKYAGSSTSATDTTDPTAATDGNNMFWYLITASNASGEGTAGNATEGPRIVNSTGACSY